MSNAMQSDSYRYYAEYNMLCSSMQNMKVHACFSSTFMALNETVYELLALKQDQLEVGQLHHGLKQAPK